MDEVPSGTSINGSSPSTMTSNKTCTLNDATQNSKHSVRKHDSLDKSQFEPMYYICHQVESDDTIQRLALKYSINIQDIKKVNKLWSDNELTLLKNIYIPVDSSQLIQLRSVYPTLNIVENPSLMTTRTRKFSANMLTTDEKSSFMRTSDSLASIPSITPSFPSYQDYFSKIDQQIQTSRNSLQSMNISKQYPKPCSNESSNSSCLSNGHSNNEKKPSQNGRMTFWNNGRHRVGHYVSDKNVFVNMTSQNPREKYVSLALERIQREKDDSDEL